MSSRDSDALLRRLPQDWTAKEKAMIADMFALTTQARTMAHDIRRNPDAMQIERKDDLSIAGVADRQIQALYQGLREKYHGAFMGEESKDILPDTGNTGLTWVVDPLDGTSNFSAGVVPGGMPALPISCTSIGLLKDGAPYMGLVRNLDTGVTFLAVAGKGAYVLDQGTLTKLDANKTTAFDTISLNPIIGFGHLPRGQEQALQDTFRGITTDRNIRGSTRILGSTAYELCLVASGSYAAFAGDAYPWDFTAGALIAKESGAQLHIVPPAEGKARSTVLAAHPDVAEALNHTMDKKKSHPRINGHGRSSEGGISGR